MEENSKGNPLTYWGKFSSGAWGGQRVNSGSALHSYSYNVYTSCLICCCSLLKVSSAVVSSASFLARCCLKIFLSLSLVCNCCCSSVTSCTGKRSKTPYKYNISRTCCNSLEYLPMKFATIRYASIQCTCCLICCCSLMMVSSAIVSSASFLVSCCLNISFSLSLDCSCCCNSATSCTRASTCYYTHHYST